MKRGILYILLLLSVVMLLPSVASAQFFAKQKVAVWQIADRNNDVKVAEGTKQQIRTSIVDAFVNSLNYEAFEVNVNDVLKHIDSQGLSRSRGSIAKVIGEKYGVNYVIFTTIQIVEHSTSYNDYKVHLSSDFISTETQKSERIAYVDMKSDVNAIPSACAELLSKLIGEQLSAPVQSQQVASHPASQQSTQPSYQQPAQPSVQTYKVGDIYDVNGKRGIVFAVSSDGKRGRIMSLEETFGRWDSAKSWCAYLGSGWRLPTRQELKMIYDVKDNQDFIDGLFFSDSPALKNDFYWTGEEWGSGGAWLVDMSNGYTSNDFKSNGNYVRAVSAF